MPRRAVLRQWLAASGSLSRRLAALGERFEVQTLRQGAARILRSEAAELAASRHRCWVREVLLRVDGVPLVWARSIAPRRALNGPWRALRGLGHRPLADLLFNDAAVCRTPLRRQRLAPHSPLAARMKRQWVQATGHAPSRGMVWARSSVFRRRGTPLRVMELFAPALAAHALPGQRHAKHA
jgi:chorismate--pyruvate lyase